MYVLGAVDDTHPTPAKLIAQPVAAELLARGRTVHKTTLTRGRVLRHGRGACHGAGDRLAAPVQTVTTASRAAARPSAATLLTWSTSTAPSTAPTSSAISTRASRP